MMKALKDLDFFCIDNLRLELLYDLSVLPNHSLGSRESLALSLDVRGGEFFTKFLPTIDKLENATKPHTILFLDCADDFLIRRYSQTRRRHPIQESDSLIKCITKERTLLLEIRVRADYVLDTSSMKTNELRLRIGKITLNRDITLGAFYECYEFWIQQWCTIRRRFYV